MPFNRVMVATFFLTGLDISHRFLTWFDGLDVPWERTMAVVAGRAGRPTAGVTRESNSVANVILTASRGRLAEERLLIAPHAPVFPPYDGVDVSGAAALEEEYRSLWSRVMATTELGGQMFAGYPRFAPLSHDELALTPGITEVHEMPTIAGPDDWAAMTTRLRVVLEDPRQLLSGRGHRLRQPTAGRRTTTGPRTSSCPASTTSRTRRRGAPHRSTPRSRSPRPGQSPITRRE